VLKLFRRKARIEEERRERALNGEQKRASQALLNSRVEKLLDGYGNRKPAVKTVSEKPAPGRP
jgi:hypothetical protein